MVKHYIETVAGTTRHMILRLANQDGTPATAADYAIYGAARQGDRIHPFGATPMDPSSVRLSIPPLEASNYAYDLYAKHTATGVEHALLCGSIRVADRVASMPPADQGGEHIEATISSDLTDITVTVQIVPVITATTWEAIEGSIATAEELLETASNLLPAARQEIATATGTAKQNITAHAAVETAAAKKEINQTAGQVAADTADIIAASGEAATSAVRQEASRATSAALESISTAEATVIAQATNDGINAIDQNITAGTGTITTAVATGKNDINQTIANGISLLDGYVGTVSDDLARKSQPNIWSGVHTFNASVILNGGGIVSTAPPLGADPLADPQRITGLLDGQQLQALYGGRPLPLTYETHATDAHYDGSKRQGLSTMQARASQAGAWQCAWLTSQQNLAGSIWIRSNTPTGGQRRVMARPGVYAINILPLATNTDNADTHPPIAVGLNAFFTGHSAGDNLPPLRWPWQPQIYPQPHHANWNQPKAIVCCEAYGHRIPTIVVYVGYGGSVIDKDVTPQAIRYNCIPCVRYKSPIADVSTITTIYFTSASNGESYLTSQNIPPTYIQTCDGQLVAVPGTPLDHRYCSMGMLAISKAGTQASACIRDIVHYPNIKPATTYTAANVQMANPVHPIETRLKESATHTIVPPRYNGPKLQDKISIAYTATAAEEYPYEYTGANIVGGTIQEQPYGNYGKTLTISAAEHDMPITCPAGWIIDVDDWSADWCHPEANILHVLPNTSGKDRYASVWIYASTNNNNYSDGTNLIYEYIIKQLA